MSSSPSVAPPWIELPSDLTANILRRLEAEERLQSAQFVCTTWWKVCLNPDMWRIIKIKKRSIRFSCKKKLAMMCRRAVDLSQGQLLDLTIAYFCDNELLHYIVNRSSHLRRLTLLSCSDVSAFTMIEAVKKLDELEELSLISSTIKAGDIEAIGSNCPMLKSFTFNIPDDQDAMVLAWMYSLGCNAKALEIAKTMPNLHHLRLLANELDNEGLQAILDGCPRFESLDLRRCTVVDLGGQLGKMCGELIKHLRLPSDSRADYEWDALKDLLIQYHWDSSE